MLRFYRTPALSNSTIKRFLQRVEKKSLDTQEIYTEWCFYVQAEQNLTPNEENILRWLLAETFEPLKLSAQSFLKECSTVLEIGPRLNFETAWSSTAVSICHKVGLEKVIRLERSLRFGFFTELTQEEKDTLLTSLHDRMTEMPYPVPLASFDFGLKPRPVGVILLLKQGVQALWELNRKMGFGWDDQDITMIRELFVEVLRRDPTDVELFQLAQANSEHSRHRFFRGELFVDGKVSGETLLDIIKTPWQRNPGNSILAFCDDSSAIQGGKIKILVPEKPGYPSSFALEERVFHPTLTAETHNFPSGVAPYPGAATGTGGRIRDNHVVGRGGLVIAGGAAYCVSNLHIPGYELQWEGDGWTHPQNLASPLDILIQASNGASDYGNCFGEPVVYGFVRTGGFMLQEGYRSWFKPIMYTVGSGLIDDRHLKKTVPEKGMLVVQIGGPGYRIGLGGGAASSVIAGQNIAELDYNAVQRGDPEMENRLNRVIRACVELGNQNPILSARDLGAGGDCNALPEIVDPAGAKINLRAIPLGDKTLSVYEIWGNESQERDALLISQDAYSMFQEICDRENLPCTLVGEVSGDGQLILYDANDNSQPVNLPLKEVLGELPAKTFNLDRASFQRQPIKLPKNLTVQEALERVLKLPSVGSKRFLTTKVDRSVTGLVAQQQCIGPHHTTLSDFAAVAHSYFGKTGTALSLGEQPLKGLISPEAMARLAVAEAILNMVGAKITKLAHIKCSANWMLAAKVPGEGAPLYDAACALRDICIALGIAIDGGKDSLSMAAKAVAPNGESCVVKAPGELVIAAYAPMPDIACKATAELKKSGNGLFFIDLGKGKNRLGGSALAQVYGEVGNECPDLEDIELLKRTFLIVQELINQGRIVAVHDRSDGGLLVTLLEMAFAAHNLGFQVALEGKSGPIEALFSEELGLVIEAEDIERVGTTLRDENIPAQFIGQVTGGDHVSVWYNQGYVLRGRMTELRALWEATSTALDALQANPLCVEEEARVNKERITEPSYHLTFIPEKTKEGVFQGSLKPKVAILREQGTNGDRELAAAFYTAGFEPWDITMSDLLNDCVSLDEFRGLAFPGGFSFADTLGAGKGWAAVICFNEKIREEFSRFYNRPDTFSLGICNGCQLMALLGWVPFPEMPDIQKPRFLQNASERFESRFPAVKIMSSQAMMLQGMAGSILGVWVAHGEGKLYVPEEEMFLDILDRGLAPVRYVDDKGVPTTTYPFNPNGSREGIAALVSPDGRHLAMMPHPERTFLTWQWPWLPKEWQELKASPWLRLFQNAHEWCMR